MTLTETLGVIAVVMALMACVGAGFLAFFRAAFDRHMARIGRILRAPLGEEPFCASMVDQLPEPAQRYFLHAIRPGTPLARSVLLAMTGTVRPSPRLAARPFNAQQVLAIPRGFLWRAQVSHGLGRLSGYDFYYDNYGGLRWWLWGLLPVQSRIGGDMNRTAAGRLALDALWQPSALLPQNGVRWQPINSSSALFCLQVDNETLRAQLTVDPTGKPVSLYTERWSPGIKGQAGYQRWRVDQLDNEKSFGGYTVPITARVVTDTANNEEYTCFQPTLISARFK